MEIKDILIHFIMISITSIIMLKIFEKNTEKRLFFSKKNIIIIILMSIICFINNLFMLFWIRTFLSLIITFIFFKIIFKENNKKTIYYTITISICLYLIELLVSLLLPTSIKNIIILNSNVLYKALFSLFVNFLQYLILTNNLVILFLKNIHEFIYKNKFYYSLLAITLIISNLWIYIISLNINNKEINIVIGLTEIFVIVLLIVILYNNYKKQLLFIKEQQLKQNLKLYSKVALEYKELKHNLMNDLLIIKSKLSKKEQPFINEIINKYKSNYEWVNSITDIPEGLQGLIFLKKNQAELKNITFNLEYNINKKVENIFDINNNFKLYEALGIIFDNAIEGAAESKEKIINVVFSYEKTTLIINIINTFSNDIDLDKIGNKDYSTKKRGSGIGLNYIHKQKNKFKVKQSIINNIFNTEITINKNEKNTKKKSR